MRGLERTACWMATLQGLITLVVKSDSAEQLAAQWPKIENPFMVGAR